MGTATPRWITVWGLAAIPFYVTAFVLAMYSVIDTDSTQQTLLSTPLAVQEMVLGVWMIARNFPNTQVLGTTTTDCACPHRPTESAQVRADRTASCRVEPAAAPAL
jgi:hypothetical protein